ncbi:MAG: DUF4965 domain-containing protein [Acidobacteriota bacterium]|nr:DUF4965 domain-containing protein [Acidobacteriota bacterium]
MSRSIVLAGCAAILLTAGLALAGAETFRPPSVPLITHDPYFSIWSAADRLTDEWPKHWTGRTQALSALVRIDGRPYRVIGPSPGAVPALNQTGLEIFPTRTAYTFRDAGIELTADFLSPLLAGDLDILSRPASYVTFTVRATDGRPHDVAIYFDASSEIAVDQTSQSVVWSRLRLDGLEALAIGTRDQPVLARKGDDLRIDWGYFYLGVPDGSGVQTRLALADVSRGAFLDGGRLPVRDETAMPRPVRDGYPVAAAAFDLGSVAAAPVSRRVILAYDDQFSIEYFFRKLRPYWRRGGWQASDLLEAANREYGALVERCRRFDTELMADLTASGGPKYALLGALSYRQSLAAHKLAADIDGTPLFFAKENFSNGCISTVDVIYPAAPMYLLFNPALVRAMLTPVFEYSRLGEWKFPFAPHDVGTYPLANGQVYGGGAKTEEDQMPVEESGNMILLAAALAKAEGTPAYALRYWDKIKTWAEYLKAKGLDPENQLCTDDFAGHLAHNANLSLKAILALRAYADLCEKTGKKAEAASFKALAGSFASQWVKMADDGDHYRLAFDKPGTWSQKYNLVWDKLLGYNLFPAEVSRKELAYYRKVQAPYGLPLDNRKEYTKLDWIFWTATMAATPGEFAGFLDPVYSWVNTTADRVPLTDWYWTNTGRKAGFQARSVVGGVLIKMLADPALAAKWAGKAGK